MTIAKSAQSESILRFSEINNLVCSFSLNVDVRPTLCIAGFCKPPGVAAIHLNTSIGLYRAAQFVRRPRFENDPWQLFTSVVDVRHYVIVEQWTQIFCGGFFALLFAGFDSFRNIHSPPDFFELFKCASGPNSFEARFIWPIGHDGANVFL